MNEPLTLELNCTVLPKDTIALKLNTHQELYISVTYANKTKVAEIQLNSIQTKELALWLVDSLLNPIYKL